MNKIELVIFDLDGTLIDSLHDIVSAVNYVQRFYGMPSSTRDEIREILGSGERLIEKIFSSIYKGTKLKQIEEKYLFYYRTHFHSTRLYPDVVATLKRLKMEGVFIAILSNKDSILSRILLKQCGIEAYFSTVVGPDILHFCKPSAKPITRLLDDFCVSTCNALIIGDSESDMLSGKMAGITTVGCTYGYGNPSSLIHADYYISALPELFNYFFDSKGIKKYEVF
ncbi:MAG: HAD hydrolase-like protein [Candidatus Nitrosotenuis sp.]